MPETTSPTELDTRTRLLDAAGPIIAARGYDRATVREICAKAGVNIASVGYHFGDKLGLYREVIRRIREERLRQFPIPDNDQIDPAATLLRIVRTLVSRILADNPSSWESQLFMSEMQNPTPVFADIVLEYFKPLHDRLIQTIACLVEDRSVPEQTIHHLAFSVIGQCVHYKVCGEAIEMLLPSHLLEKHFDIESLSRHITAVTLAATRCEKVTCPRNEP